MQIVKHRLATSEIDHELVWLVVSVGGAAGATVWLRLGLPWPHCAFLALTGHPCLTCGATRAAIQLGHGHLAAAWHLNPLMTFGYIAIAIFDLYALVVLVTGLPRLRLVGFSGLERKLLRFSVLALLALNWIYLLRTA